MIPLLAPLVLTLASAHAPPQGAPQPQQRKPQSAWDVLAGAIPGQAAEAEELDLEKPIRAAVRWLRSAQDPKTGAYDGVAGTALALRAFAEVPDAYRVADGPFVRRALEFLLAAQREDGAFCASDASREACVEQTRLAIQALMALPDDDAQEALTEALAWIADKETGSAPWEQEDMGAPPEQLVARARGLLAKQDEAGWFAGPQGREIQTARALIALSNIHAALEPHQPEEAVGTAVPLPEFDPAEREQARKAVQRGARFLVGAADERGRFGAAGRPDAGLTAMALAGLASVPEPRPEEVQRVLERGLAWLVSLQREDGSIHDGKLANYVTSAAILALTRDGRQEHRPVVQRAARFLQGLQLDEGEGYSEGDLYYGGIGYGSTERPDLSNLQMALEALSASGLKQGDATYAKALRFLERCQNRSESNDVRIVDGALVITAGDDGGGVYLPGDSKAGFVELPDGTRVPRSYGSMTYALLKCFVFAGLERDDPRLQAAYDWCRRNYTLDVNPGFQGSKDPTAAYQGLFYYFQTMAQALDTLDVEAIETPDGAKHDWRRELSGRLVAMQDRAEGFWINRNSPRWYEGNPVLATAYALITLDTAMPPEGNGTQDG